MIHDPPVLPAPRDEAASLRQQARIHMMEQIRRASPRQPDPKFRFKAPLQPGWLRPLLWQIDSLLWGRWDHWFATLEAGHVLPGTPIPRITFDDCYQSSGPRKWIEKALDAVTRYGSWQGWSGSQNFEYFLDWLLFAFGDKSTPEEPREPAGCEGASARLYQVFCLEVPLAFPADYFGNIMAEASFGRGAGFFPTPMSLVQMMVAMTFGDGGDHREKRVHEPCLGTGRMLLAASNYSYRLSGQDILGLMCKASLVNGWMYAPWLVCPAPFHTAQDKAEAAAAAAAAREAQEQRDVAAQIQRLLAANPAGAEQLNLSFT